MKIFADRKEAGRLLGERLLPFKHQSPLILAIPRGGVPIGYEVAKILKAPLDLIMVKKIGAPRNPEFAIGAVSEDSKPYFNDEAIKLYNFNRHEIKETAKEKINEVRKQVSTLRGNKAPEPIKDRLVILVDDGIATGATLLSAIQFLRTKQPRKIIVAAPVGARDSVYKLQAAADDVICLETPDQFSAVGLWYEVFNQVTDEQVSHFIAVANGMKTHGLIEEITIQDGFVTVAGSLTTVENAKGLVIFAHGSGSSRHSPRNQFVAREFNKGGFSTLLFDLLTPEEANEKRNVFDIELLAQRLMKATDWAAEHFHESPMPIAYFGASTGAGAALIAAVQTHQYIYTIISRGGRPDLAAEYLKQVKIPTLLIVGAKDYEVIKLNEKAKDRLNSSKLLLIPGATHVFDEPGTLEAVANVSVDWLEQHLPMNQHHITQPAQQGRISRRSRHP